MKALLLGFLSLVHFELKNFIKVSVFPYFWFVLIIFISTYSLFFGKYEEIPLQYGENPMADIMGFMSNFFASSMLSAISGKTQELVFPVGVGVRFFIILTLFVGLTLIGRFVVLKAAASMAGEKEKKTLYIIASSQTRTSMYFGKFLGIFLVALPMVIFLYAMAQWAFTSLFPSQVNLSPAVLKAGFLTALLFSSLGLFLSLLCCSEKQASRIGNRIVAAAGVLTTMWLFIPLAKLLSNLSGANVAFLPILDKIAIFSPFTMNLMSVYNPSLSDYYSIQIAASLGFLIMGGVLFLRQDLEC